MSGRAQVVWASDWLVLLSSFRWNTFDHGCTVVLVSWVIGPQWGLRRLINGAEAVNGAEACDS